jgi:hypothetical protein
MQASTQGMPSLISLIMPDKHKGNERVLKRGLRIENSCLLLLSKSKCQAWERTFDSVRDPGNIEFLGHSMRAAFLMLEPRFVYPDTYVPTFPSQHSISPSSTHLLYVIRHW